MTILFNRGCSYIWVVNGHLIHLQLVDFHVQCVANNIFKSFIFWLIALWVSFQKVPCIQGLTIFLSKKIFWTMIWYKFICKTMIFDHYKRGKFFTCYGKNKHFVYKTSVFLFYFVIMSWPSQNMGLFMCFWYHQKAFDKVILYTCVISHQTDETKVMKLRVIFDCQNQFKVF